MTNEEALKQIKSVCHGLERELETVIIEALEKQIQKKPIISNEAKRPFNLKSKHICPNCNKHLYQGEKFCEHCGQAIDWSEPK